MTGSTATLRAELETAEPTAHDALVAAIAAETGGNPLLISEVMRLLVAEAGRGRSTLARLTEAPEHIEASIFRKEGDYWTIAFVGRAIRLRDGKGLAYLAHLLRHPGQEIHVSRLVNTVDGLPAIAPCAARAVPRELRVASSLGDAGPLLDARATAAYQRRLRDLRDELDEAERINDLGHVAKARAEIAFITREVSAAANGRVVASHTERARQAVTKALKVALQKIRAAHPALGMHLSATVKRGYFCSYTPDPRQPILWLG